MRRCPLIVTLLCLPACLATDTTNAFGQTLPWSLLENYSLAVPYQSPNQPGPLTMLGWGAMLSETRPHVVPQFADWGVGGAVRYQASESVSLGAQVWTQVGSSDRMRYGYGGELRISPLDPNEPHPTGVTAVVNMLQGVDGPFGVHIRALITKSFQPIGPLYPYAGIGPFLMSQRSDGVSYTDNSGLDTLSLVLVDNEPHTMYGGVFTIGTSIALSDQTMLFLEVSAGARQQPNEQQSNLFVIPIVGVMSRL